jgi:glycosyltransferase involved in cell wall biosynthesis
MEQSFPDTLNKNNMHLTKRKPETAAETGPLRVLQILPSFGVGGAEQMAGHLMNGLSESLEVTGASLYAATNSPIEKRLKEKNISLWHLGKHPGFDPRMYLRLDRVLRQVRPQVVHTHLSVLRYVFPVVLHHRVPVVLHTLHNMAEHETDTFGRFINRFVFRRKVLPVAISRQVALSFYRVYGLECNAIVPNGIPVDSYRRRANDRVRWREQERFDENAVLFTCVGRLEPQKNPMLLVRAFETLNDPRAHLLLLGEGTLCGALTEYVRTHGLEQQVHLLGKRPDVVEHLAASDVFVLASNWEGNPLAVMEAMAAGLPVIGTAVGGVPELVESGVHGILVAPEDPGALAGAMRRLLDQPQTRLAMGEAARSRAGGAFSLEGMAQGYATLYRAAARLAPRTPFLVSDLHRNI